MTDTYHLFCDGACSGNPGPGGWGAILVHPDQSVREIGGAQNPTTNNQMELLAATEGLKIIPAGSTVEVYTDSSYVINGITKWIYGWKNKGWKTAAGEAVANQAFWEKLHGETGRIGKKIRWNYVPGHQGIAGNERADAIAVAMAKSEPLTFYRGTLDQYAYRILPVNVAPVGKSKSKAKGKAYYLSLVNGELARHETWSECEARVKNRANAKFKKVTSPDEEKALLASWGL